MSEHRVYHPKMEKTVPREETGLTKWDVRKIVSNAEATWNDLAKLIPEIHSV